MCDHHRAIRVYTRHVIKCLPWKKLLFENVKNVCATRQTKTYLEDRLNMNFQKFYTAEKSGLINIHNNLKLIYCARQKKLYYWWKRKYLLVIKTEVYILYLKEIYFCIWALPINVRAKHMVAFAYLYVWCGINT